MENINITKEEFINLFIKTLVLNEDRLSDGFKWYSNDMDNDVYEVERVANQFWDHLQNNKVCER